MTVQDGKIKDVLDHVVLSEATMAIWRQVCLGLAMVNPEAASECETVGTIQGNVLTISAIHPTRGSLMSLEVEKSEWAWKD